MQQLVQQYFQLGERGPVSQEGPDGKQGIDEQGPGGLGHGVLGHGVLGHDELVHVVQKIHGVLERDELLYELLYDDHGVLQDRRREHRTLEQIGLQSSSLFDGWN